MEKWSVLILLISIIIPTYNEKENLPILVDRIINSLDEKKIEIIIVDDNSPDGTGIIADKLSEVNKMIHVIHRKGKLGLGTAVVDGFNNAKGDVFGVMDADLSHPPELIPEILNKIINEEAEFVIATRYIKEGKIEEWSHKRRMTSLIATIFARPLTNVSDPMSGFFFFKKNIIKGIDLSPIGYKIGLEIIVKGNYNKLIEIPFTFQDRLNGKSKLNINEQFNYLRHLLKLYGYLIKNRF